ncbi:glycosyltransferase family 2 protein [Chloroflexota bacterium]
MDLTVVIPTFNEEGNIAPLHSELSEALSGTGKEYEIIFVDDGSSDKTFEELKSLHKKDKRVKVIKFRKNFGQSAAMSAGFEQARGKIVITMDADLQNSPADIPLLLEEMEKGYDVVSGWRHARRDPLSKKLFSKFANFVRGKLTTEAIHDSGCTLKAYRTYCLKDLELYGEMHRYIPAILSWKGYKIGEAKVTHRPRIHGKTKYNWQRILKGLLDLLLITFWQRYSLRPMHVSGGLGLVLLIAGVVLGGYLGIEKLFFDAALADRPLFLVAILMVIVGIQFVAFGVLADIMIRVYYKQADRKTYVIEEIVE